jgi:hypothetical protein
MNGTGVLAVRRLFAGKETALLHLSIRIERDSPGRKRGLLV